MRSRVASSNALSGSSKQITRVQAGVGGLVNLAHTARAEGGVDLVGAEGGARGERHS